MAAGLNDLEVIAVQVPPLPDSAPAVVNAGSLLPVAHVTSLWLAYGPKREKSTTSPDCGEPSLPVRVAVSPTVGFLSTVPPGGDACVVTGGVCAAMVTSSLASGHAEVLAL